MATKSIGTSGRDYSTLAAWASYVNALTLSAPEVGEVYNDGEVADTAQVVIGGWSGGSSTNTVTLRAASGHSFKDHADKLTNALRYNQSNGAALTNSANYQASCIRITGPYVRIEGLQFRFSADSGSIAIEGTDGRVSDCIIRSDGGSIRSCLTVRGAYTGTFENCVVYLTGGSRAAFAEYVATANYTGCTFVGISSAGAYGAISAYSSVILAKNCVFHNFTTDSLAASGGTFSASCTNNATSKSTFDVANMRTNEQGSTVGTTEFESVTSGSEDLRLKSTSAKLLDNGASVGSGYDIVGTARSGSYDIGAWEYAVASSIPTLTSAEAIAIALTTATARLNFTR